MHQHKKITILSEAEIVDIYAYPHLTDNERQDYFYLNKTELQALEKLKKPGAKLYFILQLGYFKSSNMLHDICFEKSTADIHYILKSNYFNNVSQVHLALPELVCFLQAV